MPNIVDRFNINGEEFHIEPVMDDVPTEGSDNTVKSGGVFQALQDINPRYDKAFLGAMFGDWLGLRWHQLPGTATRWPEYILATDGTIAVSAMNTVYADTYNWAVEWTEDGIHWTPCTGISNVAAGNILSVKYEPNYGWLLYVSTLANTTPCLTDFYVSSNGKNWAHAGSFNGAVFHSYLVPATSNNIMCYCFNRWWVIFQLSDSSYALYSTEDFSTWTPVTTGISLSSQTNLRLVAGADGVVVVCGDYYAYTTDGANWSSANRHIYEIAYSSGRWSTVVKYTLIADTYAFSYTDTISRVAREDSAVTIATTSNTPTVSMYTHNDFVLVSFKASDVTVLKCIFFNFGVGDKNIKEVTISNTEAPSLYLADYANGIVCIGIGAQGKRLFIKDMTLCDSLYNVSNDGNGLYIGLSTKPVYLKNAGCWTTRVLYSSVDSILADKYMSI